MKYVSMESFHYKSQVNEFLSYLWRIVMFFSPESKLISGVLEFSRRVVLKII